MSLLMGFWVGWKTILTGIFMGFFQIEGDFQGIQWRFHWWFHWGFKQIKPEFSEDNLGRHFLNGKSSTRRVDHIFVWHHWYRFYMSGNHQFPNCLASFKDLPKWHVIDIINQTWFTEGYWQNIKLYIYRIDLNTCCHCCFHLWNLWLAIITIIISYQQ